MEDIVRWRRELHLIPELGLKEYKTAEYIRKEINQLGYESEVILETGTIVFINNGMKETLAFRSDIDGLEINEKNDIDFKSSHNGLMHACGHDGHMATMLEFLKRIKTIDNPRYNFLIIFQPAEESPGAAKDVVETGIFDKYNVKAIFGMHLMPFLEEGVIGCKSGPLMAQCGELDVDIYGKGSHAGLPHQGVDSIIIASEAMSSYQNIISRKISPFSTAVLNIGMIKGGTARNSVASHCELHGTIRTYDESVFDYIVDSIDKVNKGLEINYNCSIKMTCPPMYPPVLNDESVYKRVCEITNYNFKELKEPLMLAEDFAFYQKAIPGLFFFLGIRNEKYQSGLHTETFNFDEHVLYKAVDMFEKIAREF
jgi:hippurate hydrolase